MPEVCIVCRSSPFPFLITLITSFHSLIGSTVSFYFENRTNDERFLSAFVYSFSVTSILWTINFRPRQFVADVTTGLIRSPRILSTLVQQVAN